MSGTAKTVLIVAGAGVGVFVLLKVLQPSPLAKAYNHPASSTAGTVQGLLGIGSALGKLFGGGGSSSGASDNGGAYTDAASQAVLRNFDSGNYSVSDNFMFTDVNGQFIAG